MLRCCKSRPRSEIGSEDVQGPNKLLAHVTHHKHNPNRLRIWGQRSAIARFIDYSLTTPRNQCQMFHSWVAAHYESNFASDIVIVLTSWSQGLLFDTLNASNPQARPSWPSINLWVEESTNAAPNELDTTVPQVMTCISKTRAAWSRLQRLITKVRACRLESWRGDHELVPWLNIGGRVIPLAIMSSCLIRALNGKPWTATPAPWLATAH